MKYRYTFIIFLAVFVVMLTACTRPFSSGPTPFAFPTPDLTLTAIYAVLTPSAVVPQPTATQPQNNQPSDGAVTATSVPAQPPTATPTATATALPPTPTNTAIPPTATNTAVPPTPTATPVLLRPKGNVKAYHFTSAPTLDGDFSEWKDAAVYAAHAVVFGKDKWYGDQDLAGDFQVGWDANNMYIAIKVTDQLYVQLASGANLYKGDSLEILLDTNLGADFYVQSLSPDDYQLGISPGQTFPGNHPEGYLWFPSTISGARTVKAFATATTGGYVVEAAIPWSIFGVTPQAGQHYGFALSVSDSDNDASAVQQKMVSNVSTRRLTDPTTWGDLVLNK